MTHRAVKRCFTWSTIFSSNAKVFPAGNIFLIVKILGFLITVLTCQNGLSAIYCWPSGSMKASLSLSISTSFGTISGDFDIFYYFFDETVWMHVIHQLRCVNFIVEVENGSNRWISTMKFKGANHDGLPQCSPLIGTGRSHAFRSYNRKKNEKLKKNHKK